MSPKNSDRNLLFGILALQLDFVSRDALIRAMNAWVLEKSRPLGRILGAIGRRRRLNRTRPAEFALLALTVMTNNLRYVRVLRRTPRPDLVAVHDPTNFLCALLCHYLLRLPVGARLHLGAQAVVEITGLRNPCAQLDSIQPGLMAAVLDRDAQGNLVRKAGVMGIVLASGEVRPTDPIRVELPPGPQQPLAPV